MAFNPAEHMTNLKGKSYLEVKWRLVWFRDRYPKGSIQTETVSLEPLIVRANVYSDDGILLATGHGSANLKPGTNAVWTGREIEKAETAAIGRALGHAGFGTQFEPSDDDLDNLADSPVERAQSQNKATSSVVPHETPITIAEQSKSPLDALSGNGHDKPRRMATESELDRNALLIALRTAAPNVSYQERGNTVNKMFEENAFAECKTTEEAVTLVMARLTSHKEKKPA